LFDAGQHAILPEMKQPAGIRSKKPPAGRAGSPVRAGRLLAALRKAHPGASCALLHRNPFELLVATILSAQCTDERVNKVTPALFARYPTPRRMADAGPAELEALIKSTGFFRNKAKALREASRGIVESFDGEVPRTMDQLLTLRGVARKTANVVLGTAFGINEGVVVDTHVQRLSRRMGLTREQNPERIERDLMALFPRRHWTELAHLLIWHGRRVCPARKPRCPECTLRPLCPRIGVETPP
jgi:endonuclease-3